MPPNVSEQMRILKSRGSRANSARSASRGNSARGSSRGSALGSARGSSSRGSDGGEARGEGNGTGQHNEEEEEEEKDELLERAKRWTSRKRDGWRWKGRPGYQDALGRAVLGQAEQVQALERTKRDILDFETDIAVFD